MKPILNLIIVFFAIDISAAPLPAQPLVTHGDVPAERGFRAVTLLQELEHPWGLAWLPNGDILITERPGRLRRVREGRLVSSPIAGVPEVFNNGQGGLLDVSLHPRFEKNHKIYFSYAHGNSKANSTCVA